MLRIGIFGSGAMGCLFSSALYQQADIVQIGHWPEQMAKLARDGLKIIHKDGRAEHIKYPTSRTPASIPAVDLAIILVKSWQTNSAAAGAAQCLKSNGKIITLQNGLGNQALLAAVFGADRALLGTTSQGASIVAPGILQRGGSGPTYLGTNQAASQIIQRLTELLTAVGFPTTISPDIEGLSWGKVIINCSINPLTALLQKPNGFLIEDPDLKMLMMAVANETAAVAKAAGISLPYTDPALAAVQVARATASNLSSMLQDVQRNAPTEIEAICGQVIKHGQTYQVPTPLNQRLYDHMTQTPLQPLSKEAVMARFEEFITIGNSK